ncbi:unnamed protein product [Bursaphelenchus okinawaensis]|uniref:Uncharacterized protein n=1 Tax=Bursaphelenchus okinawaensis TaxID=465554 RepID=A0A811KI34_9BILA|nr:unnamed protein product [Bursaphelenchus okinawaensis]CAG9103297.1 unnamed protein product [Bursaphelenchus okinawaensis]
MASLNLRHTMSSKLHLRLFLALVLASVSAQKAYQEEEVRVCELADLETLSWSRCEVENNLLALEHRIHQLEEIIKLQAPIKGAVAKRKNEFIRFGKRSVAALMAHAPYNRWSMDSAETKTMPMVKRKNEFIRFG